MPNRPLRIGTRGSPMALYQAELVRDRLRAAHPELAAEGALELVPIRTTGDRVQTRLLAEIGGKGLFTKEIEEALLDGRIDLAVHSLKDMETVLPAGLAIGCCARSATTRATCWSAAASARRSRACRKGRGSARPRCGGGRNCCECAPISRSCRSAATSTRGSPSWRRARSRRWCSRCAVSNGSARQARSAKSWTSMSCCRRSRRARWRSNAGRSTTRCARCSRRCTTPASAACVLAERSMLAALDGSCRTPIAGLATIDGDRLDLDALLLSPDGAAERRGRLRGSGRRRRGDRHRARRAAAPRRRAGIRLRLMLTPAANCGRAAPG